MNGHFRIIFVTFKKENHITKINVSGALSQCLNRCLWPCWNIQLIRVATVAFLVESYSEQKIMLIFLNRRSSEKELSRTNLSTRV